MLGRPCLPKRRLIAKTSLEELRAEMEHADMSSNLCSIEPGKQTPRCNLPPNLLSPGGPGNRLRVSRRRGPGVEFQHPGDKGTAAGEPAKAHLASTRPSGAPWSAVRLQRADRQACHVVCGDGRSIIIERTGYVGVSSATFLNTVILHASRIMLTTTLKH